jgi:hypothetical protein
LHCLTHALPPDSRSSSLEPHAFAQEVSSSYASPSSFRVGEKRERRGRCLTTLPVFAMSLPIPAKENPPYLGRREDRSRSVRSPRETVIRPRLRRREKGNDRAALVEVADEGPASPRSTETKCSRVLPYRRPVRARRAAARAWAWATLAGPSSVRAGALNWIARRGRVAFFG